MSGRSSSLRQGGAGHAFQVADVTVAVSESGEHLARQDSPRPYLHPVTTLRGVPVTEIHPEDHRHHLGVGLAVPDVDGTSYWGGRTYVRDRGSTLLDNHGVQRIVERAGDHDGERMTITWLTRDGHRQLIEQRTIQCLAGHSHPVGPSGWLLRWASELRTGGSEDVTVGSPATNGRPGAFYGGWFWRTPFRGATVHVADGTGEEAAHGSRSDWIAVSGEQASLVAVQRGQVRPWFVRVAEYVGFGPALAASQRLVIAPNRPARVDVDVLVLDEPRLEHRVAQGFADLLRGQGVGGGHE